MLVSSVLGPRYLTHSFSFSKVQRCGLSAVGHADASRPQPNLGRELRVSEGEVLLASLLSNRLQNERLRVSGSSKWVHGVEPRVLGTLAARLEDFDLEGVHVSCQGPAERGVSRADVGWVLWGGASDIDAADRLFWRAGASMQHGSGCD